MSDGGVEKAPGRAGLGLAGVMKEIMVTELSKMSLRL